MRTRSREVEALFQGAASASRKIEEAVDSLDTITDLEFAFRLPIDWHGRKSQLNTSIPETTSIAIKVFSCSKLQQLLDRHLSNSGFNVSGDPKVRRWHEPETGGRGCHRYP